MPGCQGALCVAGGALWLTVGMNPLDPRITPARPDLAARHLEGKVKADRFVEGVLREVVAPQVPVRREPCPDAMLGTEALKGERVMVYETSAEGWSWGQLLRDGYVGWMASEALREPGPAATHKVSAVRTLVFPGPSIKTPPIEALSLMCELVIPRIEAPFAITAGNGFVPLCHLAGADHAERDFVSVAERFVGVPYLWGGKTSLGLDCSALVQVSMQCTGHPCPRDSDMQQESLGLPFKHAADFSDLVRGDLLFWEGHVAIARDNATLIHANAFHMAVTIEPIVEAVARIRNTGCELIGVRRIQNVIQ
jgi:Bacterial dipeptidyl-peptidase Sh3 domain/NlpC/P60 family